MTEDVTERIKTKRNKKEREKIFLVNENSYPVFQRSSFESFGSKELFHFMLRTGRTERRTEYYLVFLFLKVSPNKRKVCGERCYRKGEVRFPSTKGKSFLFRGGKVPSVVVGS